MRKTLYVVLTVLILLGIVGCGKTGLNPNDPVTVSIWHVYGNQTESPFNESIEKFNSTVGKEKGIIVSVEALIDSVSIDAALIAAAKEEPGAPKLPDLFTAYPRVAQDMGEELLADWSELFTEEELSVFVEDFLEEGNINGKQLTLPIAKSTELLFVNRTLFDRFAAETEVKTEDLSTFEGISSACRAYYDWSGGKALFQYDDLYNYFLINVASLGGELIRDKNVDCSSEEFMQAYVPIAEAAIYGGLSLYDNYATDLWPSGEILAYIGSSAGILYTRDEVIYPDNTSEKIEIEVLSYPTLQAAEPTVMQRGVTLFAVKPENRRKEAGIREFVQWLIEKENNLEFVTRSGYIPGTDAAFNELFTDMDRVENDKYRKLYEAVAGMYGEYEFKALTVFENSGKLQKDFATELKLILRDAHAEFERRAAEGENPEDVMNELLDASLQELQERFE